MATVLRIESSIRRELSVSRALTMQFIAEWTRLHPEDNVVERDLAIDPAPHLSERTMGALFTPPPQRSDAQALDAALADELVQELIAADVLVIGAPMYNFSIPSPLKAWIDRVAQPGRTFRYTDKGPVGLAGGKKALIISSRGGAIAGTPMEAALDHQEAYLKTVMRFIGITNVKLVRAEGLNLGAETRKQAIERALAELKLLEEAFA